MLIRSQDKEVLVTLELLFDIEVSGGVISAALNDEFVESLKLSVEKVKEVK